MASSIRPALTLLVLFSALTGLIYPALVTVVAQAAFPRQARGSLIERDGKMVGSSLIGQAFTNPKYFWSRPSATALTPYDGAASAGTNRGPLNPALKEAVTARIEALRQADPAQNGSVPVDLVTASGSGLDPHISPAAAVYQVGRVAKARGVTEVELRQLVEQHVEDRTLGLLGEPRVNVLELNLALDHAALLAR